MSDWKDDLRQQQFVNAYQMSSLSGLSKAWLHKEAKEGRLPYIMAGRSMMFDHAKIAELLSLRAQDAMKRANAGPDRVCPPAAPSPYPPYEGESPAGGLY